VWRLWEQIGTDTRRKRKELLAQKVELQHQLILAQDKRARFRQLSEERDRTRKAEEEKAAKEAKVACLQETFNESIAKDRQEQKNADTKNEDFITDDAASTCSAHSNDSSGKGRERRGSHRGYLPTDSYAPATSPMKELEGELEDEADKGNREVEGGVVTPSDLSGIPWHHAQLYKMYGRSADQYINPKMQPEKKKVVNPTLKSQKGHMGASHIWTTLRHDSMSKLYRTDRKFPQELKEAFSAHVREGINQHKRAVSRNFTETDDVPDLNRLMDQSLIRHVRKLRHKTELMYRSSQTNNDRTKVMLFNSPLPDVSSNDEGIQKYLPSWDDAASDNTEASYMRWLKKTPQYKPGAGGRDSELREKRKHPRSVLSPLASEYSESLHQVWDNVMTRQKPRPEPRLHFLTESEAESQGAFLEKLGLDKDQLDVGRTLTRHSMSSLKVQSAHDSQRSVASSSDGLSEYAATNTSKYQTSWQPLSLQALMEYKEHVATGGEGDFLQGRPQMYTVSAGNQ